MKTRSVVPANISVRLIKNEISQSSSSFLEILDFLFKPIFKLTTQKDNYDGLSVEKSHKKQKLMYGVLILDQNVKMDASNRLDFLDLYDYNCDFKQQ